ncbi:LOW QUALITY PROTEIN: sterol regulatory element-binding protein cleavage-activating protein-like [Liolophura sinensis]|uniref:LOW QUALITY PROTEIN: sterol regulatory element-binding protein cleavage-activating protein-like n=1 Tax=Liolophura sinensis TaxID=3198878 RepID=UPI0031598FD0
MYSRRLKALQDRVAQIYYTHGLFCASHPLSIICCVIGMALLACYPLTNLPLPGNAPVEVNTPIAEYSVPVVQAQTERGKDDIVKQRWYLTHPVAYIQQIIVKATVSPWESEDMQVTDALRGPLSKAFAILEAINTFKFTDGQKDISMADLCLRVGELVTHKKLRGILPEYNCLVVSPANFWHGDFKKFILDSSEVKTIKTAYGQPLETSPTLQDLLIGVPWKKTGMSGYFLRNRRRTITFAFTIMYRNFSERFTRSLREKLEKLFPLTSDTVNNTDIQHLVHIHYKDINYFVEYTPLLVIYFVLLLYIYFSVCKIEMVKSKWGLAISAVATLIASLLMSVSICTLFGLTPTLNGGEIFPYLVMIIGLENVLVLTKSVVSTPVHLDVKYRVAQGLSKEGWSITKNLVAELLIILVGFFTFVPAIQEFCLFAVVGLLSDFFLQIVFFATVLSVDIRRMELSDLHKQSIQQEMSSEELSFPAIEPLIRCPVMTRLTPPSPDPPIRLQRSKSAPGLDTISLVGTPPSPEADEAFFPPRILPRRLRFLYFWARTRIFQRAIMVCTVIWIALIMYKTGLVEKLAAASESLTVQPIPGPASSLESVLKGAGPGGGGPVGAGPVGVGPGGAGPTVAQWPHEAEHLHSVPKEEEQSTEHSDLELWRHLSFKHWRTLLGYYNISLSGRHISILPSLHLSIKVSPQEVIKVRPPMSEEQANSDVTTGTQRRDQEKTQPGQSTVNQSAGNRPIVPGGPAPSLKLFYPQSLKEFTITVVLAILSLLLLVYFLVILYKCCCSRNYDKWRSSWSKKAKRVKGKYFRQIKDSLPLILKGHALDIECLATDGPLIVSCCLGGQLRVWDSNSGECLTHIQRQGVTPPMKRKPCVGRNVEDSDADLYAEFHEDDFTRKLHAGPPGASSFRGGVLADTPWSPEYSLSFTGSNLFVSSQQDKDMERCDVTSRRRLTGMSESMGADRPDDEGRNRSWSTGSAMGTYDPAPGNERGGDDWLTPAVWCMACQDNIIICGCGNGRIEFWDSLTGVLRYLYDDCKDGVTCICVNGNRVTAARLNGEIDFLELETFQNPTKSHTQQVAALHNRGHVRQADAFPSSKHWEEIIHYNLIERVPAHQQPINSLQSVGGRVVSASSDHTLKVFRVEDCACLYTLHGHMGSVTALHLDKSHPYAAASGSADGTVRLWDLVAGACVHKMRGLGSVVTLLTATDQFVISSDQDDILCIWERNHGQLIHTIHNDLYGFTSLAMLFPNKLVTGGQGCVCLWDVTTGEMVKKVNIGSPGRPYSVNFLKVIGTSPVVGNTSAVSNTCVICDYGSQIHVIQFPTVLEKTAQ